MGKRADEWIIPCSDYEETPLSGYFLELLNQIAYGNCRWWTCGWCLGPTYSITATIMSQDKPDNVSKYILVVTPSPEIYQWERELKRYCVPMSSFATIENHSQLPKTIKDGATMLLVRGGKLEKWHSYQDQHRKGQRS
jgi:hypothetical protein